MNRVNIVLDTNVLIAALKSKRGASYQLLMKLPDKVFQNNISVPLFIEYSAVAKREGLLTHLTEQDIDAILNYLLKQSNLHKIFFLWRPIITDPKDDLVLEVAVKSQSQYIVTFNKRDFKGCEQFNIEAVTPQEFMQKRGLLI